MQDERELTTGLLSKTASFRLIVSVQVGVAEIERLIKKLEIDKEILAGPMIYRDYEIVVTRKEPGWQAAIHATHPRLSKIDWENQPINEMTEAAALEKARQRIDEHLN
jgi:hypothetical protein